MNELPHVFEAELGDCSRQYSSRFGAISFESTFLTKLDPRELSAITLFSAITHRTVSRVIMGEELCRNKEFLKRTYSYFQGNYMTGVFILKLPFGSLRKALAWPIVTFQKYRLRQLIRVISPVVEKRMQAGACGAQMAPQIDGIQWTLKILDEHPIDEKGSPPLWRISNELIQNLWASASSPATIITQMVFQILEEPTYLEPLRREAEDAIAKNGWCDRIVNHLPLQDSFIREINRMYPIFTRTNLAEPNIRSFILILS